ncbi:MAG TPA: hypothetical protein VHF92_16055 [Geodermatophilus sp.]|nr:hypothetical protein [Geodermatophilus sp.]
MFQHPGHRDQPPRCLRHASRWLASCADCTAWHLSRQLAARDAAPAPLPVDRPAARPLRAVA